MINRCHQPRQPLLDKLRFANPETVASTLVPGESVLVQCPALVGALVGTNRRVLIVKDGKGCGYAYSDVQDTKVDKAGWFMTAICQLVTTDFAYRPMKTKDADAARNELFRLDQSGWRGSPPR